MGKRYGMRVGKRVGGVRVSAGRGGVRVGAGKQYGHARVGVSYSSRGGLGGGASFGTNAARVGTNGHGVSAGVTGKTGVVSYGGGVGYRTWNGVHAPTGHCWTPSGRLVNVATGTYTQWEETEAWRAWIMRHEDWTLVDFWRAFIKSPAGLVATGLAAPVLIVLIAVILMAF